VTRPCYVQINSRALLHNLNLVKSHAQGTKVIAMVKANAYGCGLANIAPILDEHVYALGVAYLEEALAIRKLGVRSDCVIFQGIFAAEDVPVIAAQQFQPVIHQANQLQWVLATPLPNKIKVWVKVNTGMHRLGFAPQDVYEVVTALSNCPWVDSEIGLMTHLASADEPDYPTNQNQLRIFRELHLPQVKLIKSISNSAGILALPDTHADAVRPGIMLYGVSPFTNRTGRELGLLPVMRFVSAISAIHHYPAAARIGYGGIWQTSRPSTIGVVAAGYGDGYPRLGAPNKLVWVNGYYAPIVGRVSMDNLTIDLTDCPGVAIGEPVELWGQHIPVETIALSAQTIAYELLCQLSPRVKH
jgi:alanine racemase